jgi:hypothetical protein
MAQSPLSPGSGVSSETVRVFRVEGSGNTRLLIDARGNVEIPTVLTQQGRGSERVLFLNFGDEVRAQEFLSQRLTQGHIDDVMKSFEVPKTFLEALRRIAVPQRLKEQFPTRIIHQPENRPEKALFWRR